ncbi:MAG TPA: hypothetical protein VNC50_02620 [Planctomycetia bacterium]|nr:hypothetical protein [Planctomycetia bacterium]
MRLSSTLFYLLFLGAHGLGDFAERLDSPLSFFRHGPHGWLGYLMFAALFAIGWQYTMALLAARREEEAASACLATVLLFFVAWTPSLQLFHVLCSVALLLLLFHHHWRLFRDAGSPWLYAHALVPFALVLASGCQSYGLWQKGMVVYFVALINVHHHRIGRTRRRPASPASLVIGGRIMHGRRKVNRLTAGR